jgi:hypothetical protein
LSRQSEKNYDDNPACDSDFVERRHLGIEVQIISDFNTGRPYKLGRPSRILAEARTGYWSRCVHSGDQESPAKGTKGRADSIVRGRPGTVAVLHPENLGTSTVIEACIREVSLPFSVGFAGRRLRWIGP